jgi:hypothetical protein
MLTVDAEIPASTPGKGVRVQGFEFFHNIPTGTR